VSRQISALDAFTSPTYPFVLTPPSSHPFITISFFFLFLSLHTSLVYSFSLSFFLQPQSFPFSYLVLFIPGEKPPATSVGFTDGPSTSFASPAFSTPPSFCRPFLLSRSRSLHISSLSFLIRAKRFGFSVSFSLSSWRRFLHQPEQTPALLAARQYLFPSFGLLRAAEAARSSQRNQEPTARRRCSWKSALS